MMYNNPHDNIIQYVIIQGAILNPVTQQHIQDDKNKSPIAETCW
jgi:hypothetical protein